MASKTIHYRLCGLDYVYLIVPVLKLKGGEEMIDLPMGVIDKGIAFKLIEDRVPIRGAEVLFLRKALDLSLKDWADKFGLPAAGVLKWERAHNLVHRLEAASGVGPLTQPERLPSLGNLFAVNDRVIHNHSCAAGAHLGVDSHCLNFKTANRANKLIYF